MYRRPLRLLALATALTACGCGTFANAVWLTRQEGGRRVYGGIRADCSAIEEASNHPGANGDRLVVARSVIDLPLSAIGDTLTLPYIIACALCRSDATTPASAEPRSSAR